MTLTLGRGPLAADPAPSNYVIDGPDGRLFVHEQPKRVRIEVGGEVVADTTAAKLLHETGLLPVYYVPMVDVRQELLTRSDSSTHCPWKGDASYWTVTVGEDDDERVVDDLVWGYEEPLDGAEAIEGHVAFDLDRVDVVREEEQELLGHPRDPYHRVDTLPSSRHVVVRHGEKVLADTSAPVGVFETGLPPRWYVPADDVAVDMVDSDTSTVCPYKGVARYRSLPGGPDDLAFAYDEPLPEAQGVEGHWCFLGEDVTTVVDGDEQH